MASSKEFIDFDSVSGEVESNESLLSLQVLGEILMLAGSFTFPEKKLDKLTIYSYNEANFR